MINMIVSILLATATVFNLFNGNAEWVIIDTLILVLNLPPAIVWWNKTMK